LKLKVQRRDTFILALFLAVLGVTQIVVLALTSFAFSLSAALAVLSFIAAYGILTLKKWSVKLIIGLFFPQFMFGAWTLGISVLRDTTNQEMSFLLFNIAPAIIILVFSFISFVYVATKRKSFQQP